MQLWILPVVFGAFLLIFMIVRKNRSLFRVIVGLGNVLVALIAVMCSYHAFVESKSTNWGIGWALLAVYSSAMVVASVRAAADQSVNGDANETSKPQ